MYKNRISENSQENFQDEVEQSVSSSSEDELPQATQLRRGTRIRRPVNRLNLMKRVSKVSYLKKFKEIKKKKNF